MKNLIIFAGPNGSGKSTAITNFYLDESKKCLPMISADEYSKTLFFDVEDLEQRNLLAAIFAEEKRKIYLKTGKSFVYETVFSTNRHLSLMKEAKQNGYFVSVFYVTTENANINVARVKQRVKEGGHDVPEEKIRTRHERCFELIPEIIRAADFFVLLDNSNKYELVMLKNDNQYFVVNNNSKLPLPKEIFEFDYKIVNMDEVLNLVPNNLNLINELIKVSTEKKQG